jgi:hypothetical protein
MSASAVVVEDALLSALPGAIAKGTHVIAQGGVTRVIVPIPDAFGDYIGVGVIECDEDPDTVVVTDLGRTCADIISITGKLKPATERERLFLQAARNHGVRVADGRFEVECSRALLGDAILAVVGAVKEAHQLVHFNKQAIGKMFREEVGTWLRSNEIEAERDYEVSGRSPATHTVDFVILTGVPTYLQTVSNESKMRGVLLAFYDLSGTHEFRPAAVIDDEEEYTNRTFQQLAYVVPNVFRWSQKERLLEFLAS